MDKPEDIEKNDGGDDTTTQKTTTNEGEPTVTTEVAPMNVSITEGKVRLNLNFSANTFYNPAQEVNRDISVIAIQTFINTTPPGKKGLPEEVTLLEAMAATGIRSIRYAKEIVGIHKIIANDLSPTSLEIIRANSESNETTSIVEPNRSDACALMYNQLNKYFIIDLDPYGTPVPFLEAAIKSVSDGGMLLVTATDLAILCGKAAETCFAKYGSMSLKSDACHEIALRILIHCVQSIANRHGRYVEPLMSLKIDFYVRLFFRVRKGPIVCKKSASNSSMVFQCVSCHCLSYQPLGMTKDKDKYSFACLNVGDRCEECNSRKHVGGPIWTGPIHDKEFVLAMINTLSTMLYLGTFNRLQGLLALVSEEIDAPLFYKPSQLCSVLRAPAIPMLKLRSALVNLGYEVSLSHTNPNTLKSNAPNNVIWDAIRTWAYMCKDDPCSFPEGTPGFTILKKERDLWTTGIDFTVRQDAKPPSREAGFLLYQSNPNKYFGPGIRSAYSVASMLEKRAKNQNRNNKKKKNTEFTRKRKLSN